MKAKLNTGRVSLAGLALIVITTTKRKGIKTMSEFDDLYKHYGHEVVVAQYTGTDGEAVAVAVECNDCNEVIINHDKEGITV